MVVENPGFRVLMMVFHDHKIDEEAWQGMEAEAESEGWRYTTCTRDEYTLGSLDGRHGGATVYTRLLWRELRAFTRHPDGTITWNDAIAEPTEADNLLMGTADLVIAEAESLSPEDP